jgi:hypothetical protein
MDSEALGGRGGDVSVGLHRHAQSPFQCLAETSQRPPISLQAVEDDRGPFAVGGKQRIGVDDPGGKVPDQIRRLREIPPVFRQAAVGKPQHAGGQELIHGLNREEGCEPLALFTSDVEWPLFSI